MRMKYKKTEIEITLYNICNNQSNNDQILMVQLLKFHDMYLRNILLEKTFVYLVVTLKSLKRKVQDSWYFPSFVNR